MNSSKVDLIESQLESKLAPRQDRSKKVNKGKGYHHDGHVKTVKTLNVSIFAKKNKENLFRKRLSHKLCWLVERVLTTKLVTPMSDDGR